MIVTLLTKRLPVRHVPEELRITSVGYDVVHDRRRCQDAFLFAPSTPRMTTQEPRPRLLPTAIVATLSECLSVVPMKLGVLFTVFLPVRHEPGAARVRAGRLWSMRHGRHLLIIMAGTAGLEPTPAVLETAVLPLHHAPTYLVSDMKKGPSAFAVVLSIVF